MSKFATLLLSCPRITGNESLTSSLSETDASLGDKVKFASAPRSYLIFAASEIVLTSERFLCDELLFGLSVCCERKLLTMTIRIDLAANVNFAL